MLTPPDPETERRRIQRSRNIVLGLLLAGMVALFYFVAIARMSNP
jgi:hypothetical protein